MKFHENSTDMSRAVPYPLKIIKVFRSKIFRNTPNVSIQQYWALSMLYESMTKISLFSDFAQR